MPISSGTLTPPFRFQQFTIQQDRCAMKITSDAVLLGAWAGRQGGQQILDIGAGTGILSLMAAQLNPEATVIGVEVDVAAAGQAEKNAADSPFATRIRIEAGRIQDYTPDELLFDLIISNPPFFTGGILSTQLPRASVRHTLKLSHQDLLRSVQRLMAPDGRFCVLLPYIEGLRFIEIARTYQLYLTGKVMVRDHAEQGIQRLLLMFSRAENVTATEKNLVLHDEQRQKTETYRELVDAFYLQ